MAQINTRCEEEPHREIFIFALLGYGTYVRALDIFGTQHSSSSKSAICLLGSDLKCIQRSTKWPRKERWCPPGWHTREPKELPRKCCAGCHSVTTGRGTPMKIPSGLFPCLLDDCSSWSRIDRLMRAFFFDIPVIFRFFGVSLSCCL